MSLQGLSQWGTLSDAMATQGYSALLPVTDLSSVHVMPCVDVLPPGRGKWHAIHQSETHLSQIVKNTVNRSFRQLFEHSDHLTIIKRVANKLLRSTQIVENFETNVSQSVHKHIKNVRTTHEGDVVQSHQTRNHVANNYEAGVTIANQGTNYPANKLELTGVYAEQAGYQRIRICPSALCPVVAISQSRPYTVEATAGQTLTEPSASATDPLTGNSLSVQASPASISPSPLATHTVTYSCQTSARDPSSALLTIGAHDSSSPVAAC